MNLFGWIGVFFLVGGLLFFGAGMSMRRGKRIIAVEAKIVAVHDPAAQPEETGAQSDGKAQPKEEDDGIGTTDYEFTYDGKTEKITVRCITSREAGESERMYYDTFSGALYHPRTLGTMFLAAAAFAAAGIVMIVFQNALLP